MYIVETTLRPARIALVFSADAPSRVLKRGFRLLGGRWGGVYDLLVRIRAGQPLDPFFAGALRAADPDLIYSIDPRLDHHPLQEQIEALGLQPFAVDRLRERAEASDPLRLLFAEQPTLTPEERPRGEVADISTSFSWKQAARFGLPHRDTRARAVKLDADRREQLPLRRGQLGLRGEGSDGRWLLFGSADDIDLAARFWCLRALGCQVAWLSQTQVELFGKRAERVRRAAVFAPGVDAESLERALHAWGVGFTAAPADPRASFTAPGLHYLAAGLETVSPHAGMLWFASPTPPVLEDELDPRLPVVAEHRLRSPNPEDPDGMVLARDHCSRHLVAGADVSGTRITRTGIARVRPLTVTALTSVPDVHYSEAVAAPFEQAGFTLVASDKGLYQQRSLKMARGLRYLAWLLRQGESSHLLDLFFEHHLPGKPPADYRRAVRYEELRLRLYGRLRLRRSKLTASRRAQADEWLSQWTNGLLERGLLVAGHVLRCPECADRYFYRLARVAQRFECRRCDAASTVPAEVERSFQLNEAFYQLLHHNGAVSVLLLAELRVEARWSLLYVHEVEAKDGKHARELDVACLIDGDLVLAEAKSTDRLDSKEVKNSRYVAGQARARRMIFATTARERPLCRDLKCAQCAQINQPDHRDYAWSDGARELIRLTRTAMAAKGITVESHCYESLVARHPDSQRELRLFSR